MTEKYSTVFIANTYTWYKDSFGLFDYDSREIMTKTVKGNGSFHIERDGGNNVYSSTQK